MGHRSERARTRRPPAASSLSRRAQKKRLTKTHRNKRSTKPNKTKQNKRQTVIPTKHYPKPLRDLLQWHVVTNGDFLVRDNPIWFASLVWCEMLLQLPFFFAATYAYVAGKNWIRAPAIAYGAHAATTLVPILAELALSAAGRANPRRTELLAIYSIYLAMPLAIALSMAGSRIPFPSARKKKEC